MKRRAYIGLGSNLGDREGRLRAAIKALGKIAGISVATASATYVSAPVGASEPQPDYFNAVVAIDTTLAPRALLDALQRIEHDAGRARVAGERNTARTLDLDILLIADVIIDEPGLHVPHPRLQDRAFVVLPLLEIAPDCVIPGLGPLRALLPRVAGQSIRRAPSPAAAAA
ncbi:MAG: 2-amino-4-hydroxy-6-hydroxymethyldihydropteridine diphosphokinase [Betaproteobacteria bacterium]|nr:2-amino-4-hydroxy-6-hydroxymethyldihydropteridine diphosphokinase [Betaproteobacteria bacterium]